MTENKEGASGVAVTEYTLWTMPYEEWISILPKIDFSVDLSRRIGEVSVNKKKLEKRLRPYMTQVTEQTLSRFAG